MGAMCAITSTTCKPGPPPISCTARTVFRQKQSPSLSCRSAGSRVTRSRHSSLLLRRPLRLWHWRHALAGAPVGLERHRQRARWPLRSHAAISHCARRTRTYSPTAMGAQLRGSAWLFAGDSADGEADCRTERRHCLPRGRRDHDQRSCSGARSVGRSGRAPTAYLVRLPQTWQWRRISFDA